MSTTPPARTAIVIGAGFGGLALAIRLQSAGVETTIVEARDKPGGRAYVWEKDGFTFDAGPTVITDPPCLHELWEALSWAQIGYHEKPVGLLNVSGYYDGLIAFYHKMGEVGFLRPQHQGILLIDTALDGLLAQMAAHEPIETITKMLASDL